MRESVWHHNGRRTDTKQLRIAATFSCTSEGWTDHSTWIAARPPVRSVRPRSEARTDVQPEQRIRE
jgi:hypothetical protein